MGQGWDGAGQCRRAGRLASTYVGPKRQMYQTFQEYSPGQPAGSLPAPLGSQSKKCLPVWVFGPSVRDMGPGLPPVGAARHALQPCAASRPGQLGRLGTIWALGRGTGGYGTPSRDPSRCRGLLAG